MIDFVFHSYSLCLVFFLGPEVLHPVTIEKGGGVNNTKDFFFFLPRSYSLCHVCVCVWGEFLQLVTKISGCVNDKKEFLFSVFPCY